MTSNLVFPLTDDLAEVYGTNKWNGSYDLANLVRAPEKQRSGLLTLAHSLFTGIRSTRPIMRGVHLYQRFLCGHLPTPADNNTPEGIVLEDHFSERQRIKEMTEAPGSSCVTCHANPINPLGFAFEQFDSFGRFRLNEDVYHKESSVNKGQVLLKKPVDSKVTFQFPKGQEKDYNGGVDLSYDLASNPQAQACFARNLWRFANSYPYKVGESECAAEDIYKSGLNQGSILDMLKSVPLQPEFILKKVE